MMMSITTAHKSTTKAISNRKLESSKLSREKTAKWTETRYIRSKRMAKKEQNKYLTRVIVATTTLMRTAIRTKIDSSTS